MALSFVCFPSVLYLFHSLSYVTHITQIGETALHSAAARGHIDIVKYLVAECHAVIATIATNGKTLITDAKTNLIAEYLKEQLMKKCLALTSQQLRS